MLIIEENLMIIIDSIWNNFYSIVKSINIININKYYKNIINKLYIYI